MKNTLSNLSLAALATTLGIVLMLAFAPFYLFPLAVLAFTGLLLVIKNSTERASFWQGFSFGLGLFGSGVYWIYISIHEFGDVPPILAVLLTSLLISFLALFPAATCYLTTRYFNTPLRSKFLYAFPAIWVLSEWVRSWCFTGFPWLLVGYSQTNSPLAGFAPLFSVYGVTLATIVSAALLADGINLFRLTPPQQKPLLSIYLNLAVLTALWITGGLLNLIPWTETLGKPITVSLIQGNIPQSLKWNPESISTSLTRYTELTEPLLGKSELIIWPEMAIPLPLLEAKDFIEEMTNKARRSGSNLIFGIPIQADPYNYYNGLISVGQYETAYTKRQLVPFGEYVPMRRIFARAFDVLNVPMSNLIEGPSHQPLLHLGNILILPSICYEITYPELTRTTNPDMSLILTITNDAWFGTSTAQAQHLQMAAMRSIEMRRPGLFVSNDGITAIINPDGSIAKAAPAHMTFVLSSTIQPRHGITPWMHNGIDPILVVLLIMLFTAYRRTKYTLHNSANLSVHPEILQNGNYFRKEPHTI